MCASSRGFLLLFAMRIGPLDGAKTVAHGRVEKKRRLSVLCACESLYYRNPNNSSPRKQTRLGYFHAK